MSTEELNPEHQKLWRLDNWGMALIFVAFAMSLCLHFLGYIDKMSAIRIALIPVIPFGSFRIFVALKCAAVWHADKLIRLEERPILFLTVLFLAGFAVIFSLILSLTIEQWPLR